MEAESNFTQLKMREVEIKRQGDGGGCVVVTHRLGRCFADTDDTRFSH